MAVAVVLFTRDLRVSDNPALHAAVTGHERVVPLFVLDDGILRGAYNRPNRARFLAESLADLHASLLARGGALVVRRGEVVEEAVRLAEAVGADAVHVAGDVSGYAKRRTERLREALGDRLVVHEDSIVAVPPGRIAPVGKAHMAVFTPYHRRWEGTGKRDPLPAPERIELPAVPGGRGSVPAPADIHAGEPSPEVMRGGETEARRRMTSWIDEHGEEYGAAGHDDMAGDRTSRLSPYLHFGCLSPVELVHAAQHLPELTRQVAWRDFHHQVLAARPDATKNDYRTRGDRWRDAPDELQAWKEGRTGLPLVDAAMRQLQREGWMHNRARLVAGHFLTKTLYIDWRHGAQHFVDLLLDGDTANNTMNWQWVAGTGTDSRFNRTYSVTAQALRHDPRGEYVRRYVPELAHIAGPAVHEPWELPDDVRDGIDYPDPIVDVRDGNERFLIARGKR